MNLILSRQEVMNCTRKIKKNVISFLKKSGATILTCQKWILMKNYLIYKRQRRRMVCDKPDVRKLGVLEHRFAAFRETCPWGLHPALGIQEPRYSTIKPCRELFCFFVECSEKIIVSLTLIYPPLEDAGKELSCVLLLWKRCQWALLCESGNSRNKF